MSRPAWLLALNQPDCDLPGHCKLAVLAVAQDAESDGRVVLEADVFERLHCRARQEREAFEQALVEAQAKGWLAPFEWTRGARASTQLTLPSS